MCSFKLPEKNQKYVVPISRTTTKEKLIGLVFFILTMIITYVVYRINDYDIQTANYIDIFTSGIVIKSAKIHNVQFSNFLFAINHIAVKKMPEVKISI